MVTPTEQCSVDVPYLDGSWWRIGENAPDVSPYNASGHNACDFTIWEDDAGTWHCASCIRNTSYPGSTRLFHEWTGDSITQTDWTPQGIFWTTGTSGSPDALGREMGVNTPYTVQGRLQAPHCFKHNGTHYMFHNNAGAFCLSSSDGATFTQLDDYEGHYMFFGMGRDVMIFNNLAYDGKWYGYFLSNGSAVYPTAHMAARTADSLRGPWSGDPTLAVHTEGNPESPFAFRHGDGIYLWEQGTVFYSTDPAAFHGDPITIAWRGKYAPEVIEHGGRTYAAGYGRGIWVGRLEWWPATPVRVQEPRDAPTGLRAPSAPGTAAMYDLRGRCLAAVPRGASACRVLLCAPDRRTVILNARVR
jgi:hypothetical protein